MSAHASRVPILTAWMVFGAMLTDCSENWQVIERSYPDYESAVAAHAASNLWIPESLPRSATEIRVRYDTDNGDTWIAFRFGDDLPSVLPQMRAVPRSELTNLDLHRVERVSWWPIDLTTTALRELDRPWRYEVYARIRRHETRNGIKYEAEGRLAVDRGSGRAYYWQGPRVPI